MKLRVLFVLALLVLVTACARRGPDFQEVIGNYRLVVSYRWGVDDSRFHAEYSNGSDTMYVAFWYADRFEGIEDGKGLVQMRYFNESGECNRYALRCSTLQDRTIKGRDVITARLPNPTLKGIVSWCGDISIQVFLPVNEDPEFAESVMEQMFIHCEE